MLIVSFVDETNDIASDYKADTTAWKFELESDAAIITDHIFDQDGNFPEDAGTTLSAPSVESYQTPLQHNLLALSSPLSSRITIQELLTDSSWLLAHRQSPCSTEDAYLLRHFSTTICTWLDVCDKDNRFGSEVVRRAPSTPLLLNACLAVAARHLSKFGRCNAELADHHHEKAVQMLLAMLNEEDLDRHIDTILPSTVILRLFEQLSSNVPVHDLQRHLLGGSVFINSRTEYALGGGLTQAAFWVFVLQDVQFSLAYQRPLKMQTLPFSREFRQRWQYENGGTEQSLIHRAIWILVETIQHCFGHHEAVAEQKLSDGLAEWESLTSEIFRPFYHEPGDAETFGTLWYTQPGHVIAIQHICMAKILLLSKRASNSRMGIGHGRTLRETHNQITQYADVLFGSALSTDEAVPRFFACHAACTMASWITSPGLQRRVLELLQATEQNHGWPWGYIVERLAEDWETEVLPQKAGGTQA
ncbi:hypothetical protein LTS13_003636 [Exophiala xenobiotica]|nr:hypothetical protein LTR92_000987 [Exophiala xenobiotica]KAK5380777.1 hypothetical protein LTS13_003636 [Exophiala xenobiotica]KAK5422727.1 hypothetical protein LTR06_000986 [Exophiala xenobiotica]KAK5488729.1 hypothetical protein LTR83_007483 [Exophiala xenobiotica]KAK5515904.1 hypothetical protein LTR07_007415 [Exophiala xenobiotica]